MQQRDVFKYIFAGTLGMVALAVVFFHPIISAAKELSIIDESFKRTKVDKNAGGEIEIFFEELESEMTVKVRKLTPRKKYYLYVGGLKKAAFKANDNGNAKIKFKTPKTGSKKLLDFDPRGERIKIKRNDKTVLKMTLSGKGETEGTKVVEKTDLIPTAAAGPGKADARFRLKRSGESDFRVRVEDVPVGDYDLWVDGIYRATITVNLAFEESEVEFDTDPEPPELSLDFDPRDLLIAIFEGGDLYFSGIMSARANGVNVCEASQVSQLVASSGADPDGKAKARFRTRADCDQDFKVEIEDVPAGAYDLYVNNKNRGVIHVVDTGTEFKGEIEFDTDPDDPDEFLLTFNPNSTPIEVRQGETIYFSDVFDGAAPLPQDCMDEETEIPLLNTGETPGAKGKARFRQREDCDQDFRVEIEDLPPGDYNLLVGGVNEGTITVVNTLSGPEGEIDFDTNPDGMGELPLDFNPGGQLVEIEQGGTVFLQRIFPQ